MPEENNPLLNVLDLSYDLRQDISRLVGLGWFQDPTSEEVKSKFEEISKKVNLFNQNFEKMRKEIKS